MKEHKNTLSIAERNRIVEAHLDCIDEVIAQNRRLLYLAHLDRDDVYQQLALRLIAAVEGFDPSKGKLRQHICCQLKYELLNCKDAANVYGIKHAPYHARNLVVSINTVREPSFSHGGLAA